MRTREGRNIDVEVLLRWIAEARSLPPNRDAGESATNISVSFWRELRLMKTVRSVVLRVSEAMEGVRSEDVGSGFIIGIYNARDVVIRAGNCPSLRLMSYP